MKVKKSKKVKDENVFYDKDIRKKFLNNNLDFFRKENTITVNEFGITKKRIADIFHFDFTNNTSTIFEIKSQNDNTNRLEGQLNIYTSYANIVYVVAHENHIDKINDLLSRKLYGKNVGIIVVDNSLNFKELKQATYTNCFFDTFIRNLDKEELELLCEEKGIKAYGSKSNIIGYLKRKVDYNELILSLRNKLNKFYTKECEKCGSNLYYNKYINNSKHSFCFECGSIILD